MAGSRSILDFLFSRTKNQPRTYDCTETSDCQATSNDEYEPIWEFVRAATMTSRERIVALCDAVAYIERANIVGDIVECGVWKGGSMMAAARVLADVGVDDRRIWLYDTFTGMSEPTEKDVDYLGNTAEILLEQHDPEQSDSVWCKAAMDEVQRNIHSTGYPMHQVEFIAGEVETTLKLEQNKPEQIAILRLDTDWYESTRITLEQLYPRLQPGGVLIIDDYGHWKGCRAAVDEYFAEHNEPLFFSRIDYTGRLAIKSLPIQVSKYPDEVTSGC